MDTDDVEILNVNPLGSTDTVTINDLAATDVAERRTSTSASPRPATARSTRSRVNGTAARRT